MTPSEFAIIFVMIAFVAVWRLDSQLKKIVQKVTTINENLVLMEQKLEEIGDSVSSIAINIATKK